MFRNYAITVFFPALLLMQGGSVVNAASTEKKSNNSAEVQQTRIVILGVTGELKKNIEVRLPAFKPACDADIDTLQRYQVTVLKKIKKATRALGYYHSDATFDFQRVAKCWQIEARVARGNAVIVVSQDIQITGEDNPHAAFTVLPLPYRIGDPLNQQKYSNYKSKLTEISQEKGYIAAAFSKKEILIDLKKNTAEVTLHFNTGQRFRYGDIYVQQNVLSKDYIGRYIQLEKNTYFSASGLIAQQQLLQSSGYYSSVNVQADYKNAQHGIIPVTIVMKERKRNHYLLRVGYGTDTGVRTKASLDRRWTGTSGRKLNVALGLSERINEITSQLVVPKSDPEKNFLVYTAALKREENGDVLSESASVGATLTTLQGHNWKRSTSVIHLSDKTTVVGESSNKSSLTLVGVRYAKVQADNQLFPKKGWRLRLEAEGAIDKLLSDSTVLQLRAHAKYVKKAGKGRVLLRTDFGTTFGDDLNNLPKDLRFFSGGVSSIRGFTYESLGEVNDEGRVIGGKNLLEASMEYEYPVYNDKWNIAGFVDAGNSFDEFSSSDIKVGVGMGLRWNSPIGPIRFDLAAPENDLSDVKLHLSIGPDL